ncbi:MAG TPA: DUF2321 domain-containing protein [Phycisphaerae bacterium]|nr:DUF2321 domain-containing protein [Phycisphaerae bacterium]
MAKKRRRIRRRKKRQERAKIQAAIDLLANSQRLSEEEKQKFAQSVHEISKVPPKTKAIIKRINHLIGKTGKETAKAIGDKIIDIIIDQVKRKFWPHG